MEGFGAGFPKVVAALKLVVKDRKGVTVGGCGVQRGSSLHVDGTAVAKTGSGGSHRVCVDQRKSSGFP